MSESTVTPDAALFGQKGTVMARVHSVRCHHRSRTPTLCGSVANDHCPLRFSQLWRCKIGRGYSGLGVMILVIISGDSKAALIDAFKLDIGIDST